MPNPDDIEKKVLDLVRQVVLTDQELRARYGIGEKFRFVRDRLQALLSKLEQDSNLEVVNPSENTKQVKEDEVIVYIYLFNAHGANFRSWQSMVTPKVLYEYSVNRPIYSHKSDIELMLKTKKSKLQHAYLTVAVKQVNVLESAPDSPLKDAVGHTLIKIREGTLSFDRILSFTHNQLDYTINEEGELVKQEENS